MTDENPNDRNRIGKVECPHCGKLVYAYRTKSGRVAGATTGALALGGLGVAVGSGIGIASGGWAAAATKYLGSGLAAMGGGYGYIAGDAKDQVRCPNCGEDIELGL